MAYAIATSDIPFTIWPLCSQVPATKQLLTETLRPLTLPLPLPLPLQPLTPLPPLLPLPLQLLTLLLGRALPMHGCTSCLAATWQLPSTPHCYGSRVPRIAPSQPRSAGGCGAVTQHADDVTRWCDATGRAAPHQRMFLPSLRTPEQPCTLRW